ncbi:hypothetical protein FOL47_007386 [Perkinsus chesapeaki]|uniref:Uncharacterized protein n=1 Tax=Perkinsus chesapeaki TaxID=330153 RepID=A0A7J6LKV5_PERCH|nr:hypothetical protein FOL47_007386 [Perkinsus chesapeaki]
MSDKSPSQPSSPSISDTKQSPRRYCQLRIWLTFVLVPFLSILFYSIAAFSVQELCPNIVKPNCRMNKRTELETNHVYPSMYSLATLQQHKARNVFNECPGGRYLFPVSESDAGRGFFRQSFYVDPDDDCRLWEMEPVRTSLFHNPYKTLKMTSLNPDCSSAEIEVEADAMQDSGVIEVYNRSRFGSFNYMDTWLSPIQHFSYDVLPCAVYAFSSQPEDVPRYVCGPSPQD